MKFDLLKILELFVGQFCEENNHSFFFFSAGPLEYHIEFIVALRQGAELFVLAHALLAIFGLYD